MLGWLLWLSYITTKVFPRNKYTHHSVNDFTKEPRVINAQWLYTNLFICNVIYFTDTLINSVPFSCLADWQTRKLQKCYEHKLSDIKFFTIKNKILLNFFRVFCIGPCFLCIDFSFKQLFYFNNVLNTTNILL